MLEPTGTERCWRVLLRDRRGRLWWPIVSALDEAGAHDKALVLYPESEIVAVQAAAHVHDWHDRLVVHPA